MSDFLAFYNSAVALSNGRYVSLYPLPMVYLFELFIYLPPLVGYVILTTISLITLVYLFKRKALLWVLYIPILQMLYMGQVDLIFLALLQKNTPLTLALMTLKPQLFLLALPQLARRFIEKKYSELARFIIYVSMIYLPAFIIRPNWVMEWLKQLDDGRLSHNNSASFVAYPVLMILIVIIILGRNYKGIISFLPIYRPYDYSMLAGSSLILILISWVLFYLVNHYQTDWIWAFLGVFSTSVPLIVSSIRSIINHSQVAQRQSVTLI